MIPLKEEAHSLHSPMTSLLWIGSHCPRRIVFNALTNIIWTTTREPNWIAVLRWMTLLQLPPIFLLIKCCKLAWIMLWLTAIINADYARMETNCTWIPVTLFGNAHLLVRWIWRISFVRVVLSLAHYWGVRCVLMDFMWTCRPGSALSARATDTATVAFNILVNLSIGPCTIYLSMMAIPLSLALCATRALTQPSRAWTPIPRCVSSVVTSVLCAWRTPQLDTVVNVRLQLRHPLHIHRGVWHLMAQIARIVPSTLLDVGIGAALNWRVVISILWAAQPTRNIASRYSSVMMILIQLSQYITMQ